MSGDLQRRVGVFFSYPPSSHIYPANRRAIVIIYSTEAFTRLAPALRATNRFGVMKCFVVFRFFLAALN